MVRMKNFNFLENFCFKKETWKEDKTENIKMENKICINDTITESNKCNNNGNLVENDIVNNLNIGLPILFLFQFFIYFFPLFTFPFSLFFFLII